MIPLFKKWPVLQPGLIILLTLVFYLPALDAGFIWDDDSYVTENPTLQSVEGLMRIWFEPTATPQYYPMVFTGFWLEHQLWGFNPLGYHLVNVLLHGLSAVLLWMVLGGLHVPGAFLAALVFALHPVQVESVAWVTERKNVLSALFYLLSMGGMITFFGLRTTGESRQQWRWYGIGLLFFICALLSKSVTCSLPAALLLIMWWKRGRVKWQDAAYTAPFFVLGLGSGLLTAWLERIHVGAQGMDWQLSFIERILIAGRALWFYAGKLIWPAQLTFNYPRWQIDSGLWWQYLFPLGAMLVMGLLWAFRKRLGRGPLTAVLFFAGTLFPALGFIDVYPFLYSFVADHFQYLASMGLIVLAAGAAVYGTSKLSPWQKGVATALGVAVVLGLGTQTWRQGHVYKNLETLWTDTLQKNPASWMALNNLGNVYAGQGKVEKAIGHYREALKIKPDDERAYTNLGYALTKQGKLEEAKAHYLKALQIKPTLAEAHYCLGIVLEAQGERAEAMARFSDAIKLNPDYEEAHSNLGVLLAGQGQFDEAITHFREAIRIQPGNGEAHFNLGFALTKLGKSEEAITHFSEAVRIDPDSAKAHTHLAALMAQAGRMAEALKHFSEVTRITPDAPEAHMNLSQVYWLLGEKAAAMREYEIVRNQDGNLADELRRWMDATKNDLQKDE